MKILTLNLLLIFSQFICAQIKIENIGIQFEKEYKLPNKYCLVKSISIEQLKSNQSKDYYNNQKTDEHNWINSQEVLINTISNETYTLNIPPLKPNIFYRLKCEYYGNDNVYAVMKMLHDEGINEWETKDLDWMKAYRLVSKKYDSYILTYSPIEKEIRDYSKILIKEGFDFEKPLNDAAKTKLKLITENFFKNIKLNKDEIKIENYILYASSIKKILEGGITEEEIELFEQQVSSLYDYNGFYNLYIKYFKSYFDNNSFNSIKYITFFNNTILKEINSYKDKNQFIPNFLYKINEQINNSYQTISTFAESFKLAYERAIVPDFGYVIYINNANEFKGGSPFIGVNLSLSPVNKNTPMQISKLTFWQKMSIHTGIVLNTLAEDKKRENLFKNNSAMLGFGYKILNHNFRINAGGVFYKSIDQISGSKSFAVQPYIGLSIDFEIRKWLSQLVPSLGL